LQTNLEDPHDQYVPNKNRAWVHTDNPLDSATYPRIQVRKRGDSVSNIIDIGHNFAEQRILILDIEMWTTDFKWKNIDNIYLYDEDILREWQEKIWDAIKAQGLNLQLDHGITGLKMIGQEDPDTAPGQQLMSSVVSVRLWYFKDIC